jgi:uncharacterized protein (TIGR03435 family)
MIGMLGDHLWQSTIVAAVIAVLALVFRRTHARVRYWLWMTASAKFFLPFSALAAAGAWIGMTPPPIVPPSTATMALHVAASPLSGVRYTATPLAPDEAAALSLSVLSWLLLLWACGSATVIVRWCLRWRDVARTIRTGAVLVYGREVTLLRRVERRAGLVTRPLPVVLTDRAIEPGLFGVIRPVLLWPRSIGERLSDAQVDAILAHEVCHLRRRDNLTATIHMAVEAAFWFHPLTWWIGGRLLHEREAACDEAVLALGNEPQLYAESILKTCEFYLSMPLACVSGVTGADLKQRIERIMSNRRARALSRAAGLFLGTAAVLALTVPVLAERLLPRPVGLGGSRFFETPRQMLAFAPRVHISPDEADRARFRSVSIRPHDPGRAIAGIQPLAGGRFVADGLTLRGLIKFAYAPDSPLLPDELDGAPSWVETARFDITAIAGRGFANNQDGQPRELIAMLRAMLADRFGLRLHSEVRQLPILTLSRARPDSPLGPGLRPTTTSRCWRAADGPPPSRAAQTIANLCRTAIGGGVLRAEAASVDWLVDTLGARVERIVRDETGLNGRYDVRLDLSGDNRRDVAASVERQLGLRLAAARGSVDVLVIDGVEPPVFDEE